MANEQEINKLLEEIKDLIDGRFNEDKELRELAERAVEKNTRSGYYSFWNDIEENANLFNKLKTQKGGREEKANNFLYRIKSLLDKIKKLQNE